MQQRKQKGKQYTLEKIENMWEELAGLPAKIEASRDKIAALQKEKAAVQAELDALTADKLTPGKRKRNAIQAQIYVLTLPAAIMKLDEAIRAEVEKLTGLYPQRAAVEEELKPIDERIRSLNTAIKRCDAKAGADQAYQLSREISEKKLRQHGERGRLQGLYNVECRHEADAEKNVRELKVKLGEARAERDRRRHEQEERERQMREAMAGYGSDAQSAGGYSSTAQAPAQVYSSSVQTAGEDNDAPLLALIAEAERDARAHCEAAEKLIASISRCNDEIAGLEKKQRDCDSEMSRLNRDIQGYDRELRGFTYPDDKRELNRLLQAASEMRADPQKRLWALQDMINSHETTKSKLEAERRKSQKTLEDSRPIVAEFATNNDVADLNKQLAVVVTERNELKIQRAKLRNNIDNKKSAIDGEDLRLNQCIRREKELQSDQLLITLRDQPETMLNSLYQRLSTRLADFDYRHAAGLPDQVRIQLKTLLGKADFILQQNRMLVTGDDDAFRRKYYQMCGLLWDAHDVTRQLHPEFTEMLTQIIGDETITAADAKSAYGVLKRSYPQALRDLSVQEMKNLEKTEYQQAVTHFADLLQQQMPDGYGSVYQKGRALLLVVNEQEEAADATHGAVNFDYRTHTELLKCAATMLTTPDSAVAHARLNDLKASIQHGKPKMWKTVLGAIAAFASAALALVGGLIVGAVIPGGWAAAVPAFAGSATLFGVGVGLMVSGRTKGETKAIENFDRAATDTAAKLARNGIFGAYQALPANDQSQVVGGPSAPPLSEDEAKNFQPA